MDNNFEHRLTAVEDRAASNTKRIDAIIKKQDDLEELVSTVKVLAVREENVENDVKEIKNDVKDLKTKPGQRWDKLVDTIIGIIVGALIGFVLTQIGF